MASPPSFFFAMNGLMRADSVVRDRAQLAGEGHCILLLTSFGEVHWVLFGRTARVEDVACGICCFLSERLSSI